MAARKKRIAVPAAARKAALEKGRSYARQAIAAHRSFMKEIAAHRKKVKAAVHAGPGPLIVAEGDSWFDYPLCDVLTVLQHSYGYTVRAVAHAGDTVESMAYDPDQLTRVVQLYGELTTEPQAVLLSGGGNDIAGSAIEGLLNHHNAPVRGFNESVMKGVFDERIHLAMVTEIGALSEIHKAHFGKVPQLVIHGYDYAVPDNRGYLTGIGPLPGPWLAPQFRRRGYQDLEETRQLMHTVIDRFNAMQQSVAGGFPNVTYVNVRNTLSNVTASNQYRKDWANELHPTRQGFFAVAAKFDAALKRLP